MFEKIKKYISHHKIEITLLIVILVIAAFFRIYKISDYMTSLGTKEGMRLLLKTYCKEILHFLDQEQVQETFSWVLSITT